jgi:aryl-alcohol dehydrogenase-like predicted oxidoreductase
MKNNRTVTRRKFVGSLLGGVAAAGVAAKLKPLAVFAQAGKPTMPTRPLGRTGHDVCLFSLGGQATVENAGRRDEAIAIVNGALDLGVNYVDTAPSYGGGVSERYIGEVMKTRRKEVFLATKTHDRSYDGSMRLLEQSLKRLNTDRLDLWQVHNVRTQGDLDFMFSKNGAIRALEQARSEKIVRFLGITGHRDPFVLKQGIERYPFDAILMAMNAADRHDASFIDNVLPVAVQKNMAIIGMKVPSHGSMFRNTGVRTMKQAMGYVLTLPVSTVIIGISTLDELEENVRVATNFKPYTKEEMAAIEALTKPYFADATWYKTKW